MTYQEALDFLFNQIPNYQKEGGSAYKPGLDKIRAALNHLGNPEMSFDVIHVAGTNGKGTVSHMLASILIESSYKTGLYTSPHLLDFTERIRLNGAPADRDFVVRFVNDNQNAFRDIGLSFFEWTFAMACEYFRECSVEIAVIETGLGGRLDATNVVDPLISIITSIAMDHTEFLGETIGQIASEKAGIIKSGRPVVYGKLQDEAVQSILDKAAKEGAKAIGVSDHEELECDLQGPYVSDNQDIVLTAIRELSSVIETADQTIAAGMNSVCANTGLRGRWETLSCEPLVLCDTGHNVEALQALIERLQQEAKSKHIVFGSVSDKDHESLFSLLPKDWVYYWCESANSRSLRLGDLKIKVQAAGLSGTFHTSVESAVENAIANAGDGMVFIGGSTFVVADALKLF